MVTKSRAVKWDGVAKIDLAAGEGAADACVGRIKLPPGHYNGETVFVPRCGRARAGGRAGVEPGLRLGRAPASAQSCRRAGVRRAPAWRSWHPTHP
jgi:hypothetical protein